jgi:hypothetical protein
VVEDGGDGAGGDVAVGGDHLVVDLDQQGANEPDDRFGVGEDLHDIGAALELPIEALD